MKEIEKTQKKKPPTDTLAQLKELLNPISKPDAHLEHHSGEPPKKMSRRERRFEEEYVAPEPIRHEFFDESVSKYFQIPPRSKPSSADEVQSMTQNVLLENVYRMFGITAFPVKDPSRPNSGELLGVRIEIFNERGLKFDTPHYIILEQDVKTTKWRILNHTIPAFVQLRSLAKSYDDLTNSELLKFIRRVRFILDLTSQKLQVMELVRQKFKRNISQLQTDVAVTHVKFHLSIDDTEADISMRCGLKEVDSIHVENGFSETEKQRIVGVLKGDVKEFADRLGDMIEGLTL